MQAMKKLDNRLPDTMKSFTDLHRASTAGGVLSTKTKELLALNIAIIVSCDGCIAFHVHYTLNSGASSEEILHATDVAVIFGGGPSVVYGCKAMAA